MKPGFSSIRVKLVLFALSIFGAAFSLAGVGLMGIRQVARSADRLHLECLPILECTRHASEALIVGAHLRDVALLSATQPEAFDDVRVYEGQFQRTDLQFDMYIQALIWGSDSWAFRQVSGGLTAAEWDRFGLTGRLIVPKVPDDVRRLASHAELYYAGFSRYTLRAMKSYRKALRLRAAGDMQKAAQALDEMQEARTKSQIYASLVRETFGLTEEAVEAYVKDLVTRIAATQRAVRREVIVLSGVLIALLVVLCVAFSTRVITRPIRVLIQGVEALGRGALDTRIVLSARDEFGQLAAAFNQMVGSLQQTTVSREALLKEVEERQQAVEALQREKTRLEHMNEIMMGREERILELKQQINTLLAELGRPHQYAG